MAQLFSQVMRDCQTPLNQLPFWSMGRLPTRGRIVFQNRVSREDLIITSFATIADDVDAQCENIRRYHAIGCVGFILFYIGLILPSVDDRVIACCNELDLVLITMPRDIRTHKYSDVIGDIYHAIFKDQQAGSNYVSTLIRRFSNLPAEQRNTGTITSYAQQSTCRHRLF